MDNKVLATVNGIEITQGEAQAFIRSLGEQTAMQIQSQPDGISRVVNELVNQNLMYLDSVDNKVDEEESFKSDLEKAKKNLLIQYSVNKVLNSVPVSVVEMEEYYKEHSDQFKKPETIRASHILVKEEDEAKEIMDKISGGLSFEEASKEYSECPSKEQGGDLGEFARGSMVAEFEEAAFRAELNKVIGPVKTQFGYHIVKTTEKNEESISPYEEVESNIKEIVTRLKQQETYLNKISELREKYEVGINE